MQWCKNKPLHLALSMCLRRQSCFLRQQIFILTKKIISWSGIIHIMNLMAMCIQMQNMFWRFQKMVVSLKSTNLKTQMFLKSPNRALMLMQPAFKRQPLRPRLKAVHFQTQSISTLWASQQIWRLTHKQKHFLGKMNQTQAIQNITSPTPLMVEHNKLLKMLKENRMCLPMQMLACIPSK